MLAHSGPAGREPLVFEQVEFSHPLWVLFSSGTTGLPKGLAHSHGGITLEGTKWSGLYCGLRAGERMFTYSSTGWALWNMQLGALMQGASIVLYEGSPSHPAGAVWEVAARTRADVMLLGAAVVTASANAGVSPRQEHDLSRLRHFMVSGSALPAAGYRWVMEHVRADLRIDSTSGGTDVSGSFVGSNEYAPARPGRIGGRLAGVDCAAWNEDGVPVVDTVGDLVVTQPMPSMPVCLWRDPDAVRYTESYFDTWPGVWRHGDWVTIHSDGSVSMHGRSDSTLNRQGVRLGSSDFYDVLETMPEISETLVIGVELPDDGYWLGLFVVPASGHALDDGLKLQIVSTLAAAATATQDVELGTATVQVPLYHPAHLAHRVLSLMSVCGGRLTLGVSPGSTETGFATLDRDYTARFATFHRNTARLRVLLASGRDQHRYAQAGFDDAVVLLGPGAPDPEEVRALLPRESPAP